MPEDLQINIVTNLDSKGTQDAQREIKSVADVAKKGAIEATQETSKWALSKKALTDNVKSLKYELSNLPYLGQVFHLLRNPVALLGAGIGAVAAQVHKLSGEIDALYKPREFKFPPKPTSDPARTTDTLQRLGAGGKAAVEDVGLALGMDTEQAATYAGIPGLEAQDTATRKAIQRYKDIIADRESKMGFAGDDIMPAFYDFQTKSAEQAKAQKRLAEQNQFVQDLGNVTWDSMGWHGDKALISRLHGQSSATGLPVQKILDESKVLSAAELAKRKAAFESSTTGAAAAKFRLAGLAPGVGTEAEAASFITARDTQLRSERDTARTGLFGLWKKLRGIGAELNEAYNTTEGEFGNSYIEPMSIRRGLDARSQWNRSWGRGQAPPERFSREQGRINSEMRSTESGMAPLLFSVIDSDKALLAEMAAKLNQLREQLDTIKKQLRDGDFR